MTAEDRTESREDRKRGQRTAVGTVLNSLVCLTPWGCALILPIAYAYSHSL